LRLLALGTIAAVSVALAPANVAAGTPTTVSRAGVALAPSAPTKPNVVASGLDWPQFHNGATHDGYNAQEQAVSPATIAALKPAWSASTGGSNVGSVVVANGVVYVPSIDHNLYAYAVDCASGGGTCVPLWSGSTGAAIYAAPTVTNGVVYVGSDDGKLYAFDAAGVTGCTGTPKVCLPLWTGAAGTAVESSPTVADGVVYVGSIDKKLYAFDAAGVTGCSGSPTTCTALWTGATGNFINNSPAVAGGVVYIGSWDTKLYAFAVGCASGGGTCSPIWTGATGAAIYSSPAVVNGVVYVGSNDDKLYAFAVGCAGGGGTCTPVWTGATGASIFSSPAVANGVVYVGSNNNELYAFAVGCAAGGGTCTPLWTGAVEGQVQSSPAVADGVVYVGADGGKLNAFAVGCASGGGACSTIWSATTGGAVEGSPAVADGVVYVGSNDGGLYAYALEGGIYRTAATYHAIAPARVLDTRPTGGAVVNMGLIGAFVAGTVRTFGVANAHYVLGGTAVAVPIGATAVTGNLTIVGESAAGVIALGATMTPTGEPTTINFIKGDIRANNVTVGLSPTGTLSAVFRSATVGAITHLIFDVTGYFTPNTTGATYHSATPARILDTRTSGGAVVNIGLVGKFKSKVVRTFNVSGAAKVGGGVPVPVGATAVTGNMTVTNATSDGFVSVGPTMIAVPKTSNVNIKKGINCANGVTVALNAGKLQAVWDGAAGSTADIIFDVTGYFTADLTGASYHPIVPVRYLDSSLGKGLTGSFATGTARTLGMAGVGQVPNSALGISGNLTLVNPSTAGWAQIAPTIAGIPTSSTVNAVAHQTLANGFDVPVSGTGDVDMVWVGRALSTAHLQLDVTGYWK
jgi:outer membrane protein assembly factor BamB